MKDTREFSLEEYRKSNFLVNGQYRFGILEQKILLAILAQIQVSDVEFRGYTIPWDTFRAISGRLVTETQINDACKKLKDKTIAIKDQTGNTSYSGFLSGWTPVVGRYVEFRIDPVMESMLLFLVSSGNFTIYQLEYMLSLRSTHSIRLYEILKSYKWRDESVMITLADLRWRLAIKEGQYRDFGNFRRTVLDKAKKDFHQTDILFTYEVGKKGKSVDRIFFHLADNESIQTTVHGAIGILEAKKIEAGATVVIGGEEFIVEEGGVVRRADGVMRLPTLEKLVSTGKARLK